MSPLSPTWMWVVCTRAYSTMVCSTSTCRSVGRARPEPTNTPPTAATAHPPTRPRTYCPLLHPLRDISPPTNAHSLVHRHQATDRDLAGFSGGFHSLSTVEASEFENDGEGVDHEGSGSKEAGLHQSWLLSTIKLSGELYILYPRVTPGVELCQAKYKRSA